MFLGHALGGTGMASVPGSILGWFCLPQLRAQYLRFLGEVAPTETQPMTKDT